MDCSWWAYPAGQAAPTSSPALAGCTPPPSHGGWPTRAGSQSVGTQEGRAAGCRHRDRLSGAALTPYFSAILGVALGSTCTPRVRARGRADPGWVIAASQGCPWGPVVERSPHPLRACGAPMSAPVGWADPRNGLRGARHGLGEHRGASRHPCQRGTGGIRNRESSDHGGCPSSRGRRSAWGSPAPAQPKGRALEQVVPMKVRSDGPVAGEGSVRHGSIAPCRGAGVSRETSLPAHQHTPAPTPLHNSSRPFMNVGRSD